MIAHSLVSKFKAVPSRKVVLHDWHSPEGREFLAAVEAAIEAGVDVTEVGSAIGIHDFSMRWKIIGRGRR